MCYSEPVCYRTTGWGNETQTHARSTAATLRASSTRRQAETSVAVTDIANSNGHLELTLAMLAIDATYLVSARPVMGHKAMADPDTHGTKI